MFDHPVSASGGCKESLMSRVDSKAFSLQKDRQEEIICSRGSNFSWLFRAAFGKVMHSDVVPLERHRPLLGAGQLSQPPHPRRLARGPFLCRFPMYRGLPNTVFVPHLKESFRDDGSTIILGSDGSCAAPRTPFPRCLLPQSSPPPPPVYLKLIPLFYSPTACVF